MRATSLARHRHKTFYAEVLAAKEAAALERARLLDGVDDVLAVPHLALRDALHLMPRNLRLIFQGADAAARLLTARHKLAGGDKTDDLIQRIERVRETFDDPNKDPPT